MTFSHKKFNIFLLSTLISSTHINKCMELPLDIIYTREQEIRIADEFNKYPYPALNGIIELNGQLGYGNKRLMDRLKNANLLNSSTKEDYTVLVAASIFINDYNNTGKCITTHWAAQLPLLLLNNIYEIGKNLLEKNDIENESNLTKLAFVQNKVQDTVTKLMAETVPTHLPSYWFSPTQKEIYFLLFNKYPTTLRVILPTQEDFEQNYISPFLSNPCIITELDTPTKTILNDNNNYQQRHLINQKTATGDNLLIIPKCLKSLNAERLEILVNATKKTVTELKENNVVQLDITNNTIEKTVQYNNTVTARCPKLLNHTTNISKNTPS